MSDRDKPPNDLLDAVFRLDDIAEWLGDDWPDEALRLRRLSQDLKGYIRISAAPGVRADKETKS